MNKLAAKGLKTAFKIVAIQSLVVVIAALLGWIFLDVKSTESLLLGGLAAVVPNAIFVLFTFSRAGASQLQTIMRRFYRGATLKLILSGVFLALAMKAGMIIPWLFIGFIIAIFAHIFAPVSIT